MDDKGHRLFQTVTWELPEVVQKFKEINLDINAPIISLTVAISIFKTLSFNYKYSARSDCQLDPQTEKYTNYSSNTYSKWELSLEFISKE